MRCDQGTSGQRPGKTRGFTPPGLRALVVLAALLPAVGPNTARAETQTFGYLLAWGHLTLAEAEVSYRQSGSNYHLMGQGRTRGILELFFPWQGRARTEGLLSGRTRLPLVHQHEGIWKEKTRWTRVEWDGTAAPRTEARPPPDPEKVTPVPEASTVGTSDPFTALLSILDRLPATGRCDAEASVWDGRRRYNLSVSHLGEKTLVADRPWAYEGPAIGCALSYERIGGFWRERPDWRDPDEDAPGRRVVWVAEIAPERWVVVRAEMETRYGTVVGRLLPEGGLESERADAPATKAALFE